MADANEIIAYTIPHHRPRFRLWMCLRCAKTYPEGPDKRPETEAYPWTRCGKCHVKIRETEER
jgi:DNA-directed RNA polymerase subunit RPC12/RpoP